MKGSRELFLSFCLIWFVCPVFIFFLLHKVLDIPSQSLSWSSASVFENRVFVQFSDLHVRLFFHETHFSLLSLVANKSWLAVYVMWNCNSDHPVSWVPAAIIYCPVTNPFALKHSPTTLFQFCIKTDSPCSWPSELVPWFNIFTKEIKQLPCNNRKGLRKMGLAGAAAVIQVVFFCLVGLVHLLWFVVVVVVCFPLSVFACLSCQLVYLVCQGSL